MFCNTLTKVLYLMYLQFRFYLDLYKTKIFLSSYPHYDGNSYADKLKNPHMRKKQPKLKNQHAGNRPLRSVSSMLIFQLLLIFTHVRIFHHIRIGISITMRTQCGLFCKDLDKTKIANTSNIKFSLMACKTKFVLT